MTKPAPPPAAQIAEALAARFPGAAVLLYGSGMTVSASEPATSVLFDFYVVVDNYRAALRNRLERLAARLLPPNVYYFELPTPEGTLRAKYALLSLPAFERLLGPSTFHSYFWARFAQPTRLVRCPAALRPRIIDAIAGAVETFLRRAAGLANDPADWRDVWRAGLRASYRAELRAETDERADRLIDSFGEWPRQVASFVLDQRPARLSAISWRMRALAGTVLSAARLLKATATFHGGIDYIAWKVKRHAGVDVAIKPWERRRPFLAAPIVALRYYRLRAAAKSEPDRGDGAAVGLRADE